MKTFDEYIERIKINTVPGPMLIPPRGGDEGGVDFSSLKKKEYKKYWSTSKKEKKSMPPLSVKDSENAFDLILSQNVSEKKIIDFLISLNEKGPSVDEILGAVKSIKKKAKIIEGFKNSFDTCGTGGDNAGTFNISTLTAIIISCCDVRVAKHGNKAVTSKSGSADVLTELGVNINIDDKIVIKCLEELNLCFLFAPNYHPILKNVADIRKKIGYRTIFNLLGPLLNPVECEKQIIGVFQKNHLRLVAEVLKKMETKKVWVVCGDNEVDDNASFDELTTAGNNYIIEINKKIFRTATKIIQIDPVNGSLVIDEKIIMKKSGYEKHFFYKFDPESTGATIVQWKDAGDQYDLPIEGLYSNPKYLIGGNSKKNAEIIIKILSDKGDSSMQEDEEFHAKKNTILFNCAAALMVAEKTKSIAEGFEIVKDVIHSGAAFKKLTDLIKITNTQ